MNIIIDNHELTEIIRKAVQGNKREKFEIILIFQNLIKKEAMINGKYSEECRAYIEDKLFKSIENFKKN